VRQLRSTVAATGLRLPAAPTLTIWAWHDRIRPSAAN
jgi:hypothetical protein